MSDLLISGMSLAGLVAGAILDPVGQRLAERSQIAEERRKLEYSEKKKAEEAAKQAADTSVDESPADRSDPVIEDNSELEANEPSPMVDLHHLLPQGRSTVRLVAASIITGGLFAGLGATQGKHLILAPLSVFVAMLVTVSTTDLSYRLVPRWLIYGGLTLIVPLLLVTAATTHQWHQILGAAIAGAIAFVLFFAVWWFFPRGMGYGDVRLAGAIGVVTGYLSLIHTYLAFLGGFILGMVFGMVMISIFATGRKTRIPFAPSLAAGAVLSIFFGAHVAHMIFGTTG